MKRRSQSGSRLAAMSDDDEFEDDSKENDVHGDKQIKCTPVASSLEMTIHKRNMLRSPLTPMANLVISMKQKLESQLGGSTSKLCEAPENKTSPGLAKLRDTPQGSLKRRQAVLAKKHKSAQDRIDSLNVGGGISIWPQMANMRLTMRETFVLAATSFFLMIFTALLFTLIHGDLEERLRFHHHRLLEFPSLHQLVMENNATFKDSVLHWHRAFTEYIEDIHNSFNMSLTSARPSYQLAVLLYIIGILTLLYYLADNIVAQSKLTPRRIKIWVSLLVIMGTWTFKVLHLLVLAHRLEYSVETVIHTLSQKLSSLVYMDLNLDTYHDVLLHWRTCCLPPTTIGTLSVMGVVSIRDIMYYLQYYSLPVGTALLTPVLKLVWSLMEVYGFQSS